MMKKLIYILLLIVPFIGKSQTYDPTKAGTALNKGIAVRGIPVDSRSYYYDAPTFTLRPFTSTAEVLTYFNNAVVRAGNFNIYVTIAGVRRTYQFRDGVADGNLVLVDNIDATSGVTSINGLTGSVTFTKSDITLGNVDNTSDATKNSAVATLANKTLTAPLINTGRLETTSVSGYVITAIDNLGHYSWQPTQAIGGTVTTFNGHSGAILYNKDSAQLGNVNNTSDVNKPVSTAQQTALNLKADASALAAHIGNISNPHNTTKAQVNLGNADNTSDVAKPVSTLQAAAIALKADAASPVFTGTFTGTYILGGNPSFPSAVTQNSASQTLINKIINGANNTLSNVGTISNTPASTTVALGLSTGTGTTLPAATHSVAGVLIAADKTRLDSNYTIVQPLVTGQVIGYAVDAATLRLKSLVAGTGITITNTGDSTLTVTVSGAITGVEQTLVDAATVVWNVNNGLDAVVTLGGNRALSITNLTAGMYGALRVIQDGSGSRTITLPAGSKVINGGSGVIPYSTTAGTVDIIIFKYNGSTLFWTYGKNYN